MKKSGLGIFFAVLTVFFSLSFVSAETAAEAAARNTATWLTSTFAEIGATPTMLSAILLGILLYIVIYSIVIQMKLFGGKTAPGRLVSGTIALIITILAFVAMPANFIESIVLQYGAAGAAILAVIPLLILLYFSLWVTESLFIARIVWVFYTVYYIALFIYQLATVATAPDRTLWIEYLPYGAAILAGFIIFLCMKGLRGFIFKGELDALEEKGDFVAKRGKVLHKLQREELEGSYGSK